MLFGKEVIKNVTYLNTEHLGTQEYDRRAVFDVYCENEQGEKILVEMQRGEQQFFKDRSSHHATFPIREQAPRGEWDYELKGSARHRHPQTSFFTKVHLKFHPGSLSVV